MDLHLVVPRDMSIGQAHALSTHLEDEIAAALPYTEVTIHMEPEEEAEHLPPVMSRRRFTRQG